MKKELKKAEEILRFARESKGLTQTELADKLGIGLRMYQKIEDGNFPKYKIQQVKEMDLILGTNLYELIYEQKSSSDIETEKTEYISKRRELKNTGKKRIPFYDAEAAAGNVDIEMTPIHAPAGTIDIGDLLHDSEAAIRIYGNSMLPNYPPGCVVGLSKCTTKFIEPGEVYVIETRDRRMLKRLFYKDDDANSTILTCYSDNTMKFEGGSRAGKDAYPPFNIPLSEIVNLFVVTGVKDNIID